MHTTLTKTDSEDSNTTAPGDSKMHYLPFLVLAVSSEIS